MQSRTRVFGASVFAACLSVTTVMAEGKDIDDVEAPDKAKPMAEWTAAQQWSRPGSGRGPASWGYNGPFGWVVFADEMGDKLSELGRISMIRACFEYAESNASAAVQWAVCGSDVKAVNMKKLQSEVDAAGLSEYSRNGVLSDAKDTLEKMNKIGAAVEAAAKDDKGVAQILKLAEDAKAEWQKYIGANKAAFERYLALKDAVRSSKSNHKSFTGCWEATEPAFAKLVKKTKFPWELPNDYLPGYVSELLTSTENYITAASFALCSYSIDKSGEALVAATLSQPSGGTIRVGWRTIAIAKILDPKFTPKFADRSLSWGEFGMPRPFRANGYKMGGVNEVLAIMTPATGEIATAKPEGDMLKLTFKGNTVDACLQWKETNKIQSRAVNGDPIYERKCMKRGKVANEETPTEIHPKFAAGAKPKSNIWIVGGFPVTTWKAGKFTSVLGVACNCGKK
jgi:hypothetical protein